MHITTNIFRSTIRLAFVGILFGSLLANDLTAQSQRLIPLEDPAYVYIQRLQRRGLLLTLHPTALPYHEQEIQAALAGIDATSLPALEQSWLSKLRGRIPEAQSSDSLFVGGLRVIPGFRTTNHGRLDPLRYRDDDGGVYSNLRLSLYMAHQDAVAQWSIRQDLYYRNDPDGLRSAQRLISRNDQSYVGYRNGLVSLFVGQYNNHWAPYGAAAGVVSMNPYGYDHINFKLGGQRLSLRSIVGELDSITQDGRFTGTAGDDSVRVGSERRYLSAHRIDWRPSPKFALTLLESTLYSGPNTGFALKYFNPVHAAFVTVDNRPKNEENNGMIAGMLWAQHNKWTVYGQLMIDDLDVLKQGDEPASFSLLGTLHYAALAPAIDAGLALEAVAARTYNALQVEGKYVYLQRGLATQFSDYVSFSVFADIYLDAWIPSLTLTPSISLLSQGELDIRDPFPRRDDDVETILNGTVERTVRTGMQFFYTPLPQTWIRLDIGINQITNYLHEDGRSTSKVLGLLQAGTRIALDRPLKLHF